TSLLIPDNINDVVDDEANNDVIIKKNDGTGFEIGNEVNNDVTTEEKDNEANIVVDDKENNDVITEEENIEADNEANTEEKSDKANVEWIDGIDEIDEDPPKQDNRPTKSILSFNLSKKYGLHFARDLCLNKDFKEDCKNFCKQLVYDKSIRDSKDYFSVEEYEAYR
ncbi:5789_t:CDS:2, partial [Dentiscutata heterogama]